MRILEGLTPPTRLSFVIMLMTMSVIFLAEPIGLVPNHKDAAIETRLRLSEAIALQLSAAASHGNPETLDQLGNMILERSPDVRTVGIRGSDGSLLFSTGDHEKIWTERSVERSDGTRVTLPLMEGGQIWGAAELSFEPLTKGGLPPIIILALFVPLFGFFLNRAYLRSVLKHLDPSSVIPQRVKDMLDTMAEGVVVLDKRERIVLANEAFTTACGISLKKLQGRKASEIPWKRERGESGDFPWLEAAKAGEPRTGVQLGLNEGEDEQVFIVNSTPIFGGSGDCRGALATFDNVTEVEARNVELKKMITELNTVRSRVQEQNEELQMLAARDTLTGCLSRHALFERLDAEWAGLGQGGRKLACIMTDVDHFKAVNDNHGHGVGDEVLKIIGQVLQDSIRKSDVVGRYGGEEFCILLPGATAEQAGGVGEKIRLAIEASHPAGLDVTVSVGVSSVEFEPTGEHDLIDQADQALYTAKRSGRNRVVRWDQIAGIAETPEDATLERVDAADDETDPLETSSTRIPFNAVLGLLAALHHRDPETAAHSHRVAELCLITAEGLMSSSECFVLEVAALLHDIGKIGVPDAILLKPGPLNDDEWRIMQRHDDAGTQIISEAFHCPELNNIIKAHHAKYGGSETEPNAPRGGAIPLRSRILTIADAFDAMVSDRVYRKGRSPDKAFEELRRCAGTQFDPMLVERFINSVQSARLGRSGPGSSSSLQIVLDLGLASERLTWALDEGDPEVLVVMARRLSRISTMHQWPEITSLAAQLAESLEADMYLEPMLEVTRELLMLCQTTQQQYLDEMTPGAPD